MTLLIDNDGSYEDQSAKHRFSSEVLRVVQTMEVGQKVLIIEEDDRNIKDEEGSEKETRIWFVHFSAFRLLLTR